MKEKQRGGDNESRAQRRKLGPADGKIAVFIQQLLDKKCDRYLSELCTAVYNEFKVKVAVSTMHLFVSEQLGITRKRLSRLLPRQALTEKNLAWRKAFVSEWFLPDSFQLDAIGTKQEFDDQHHWRLKLSSVSQQRRRNRKQKRRQLNSKKRIISSDKQLFFIDETGVNRHSLRRSYGRARRGKSARVEQASFSASRGANHSTIIAIGAAGAAEGGGGGGSGGGGGVIAHRVLVGVKRGTRRDDFCSFLSIVGKQMLLAADRSGLPSNSQLYLIMDNASIHKGGFCCSIHKNC